MVAARYSIDRPTRDHGGLLRRQRRSALERPLGRAVFRARVDRLVGPVRTQFGYYVFKVVRVHPRRLVSLAVERKRIRAHRVANAEQAALDAFVTAWQAKWRARTTCAPAYAWEPDCANYDGTPVPTH